MAAPKRTVDTLLAHGYQEEQDERGRPRFTRYRADGTPRSQQWVWDEDSGSWERYELNKPAYPVAPGYPWLEPQFFAGVVRQRYPYRYRDEFQPSARYEHPDRWEWDWPDDDVYRGYATEVQE